MADYSPNEIVDIIMTYGATEGNASAAVRRYRDDHPNRRHPNRSTIIRIVRKARGGDLKRKRSKKDRAEDPVTIVVLGMIAMDPHISQRQMSRELNISQWKVGQILKNFHFHPYHIALHQELSDDDKVHRVAFCRWAQAELVHDPTFFNRVMFSDEATFQNTGELNRHNCHYYSEVNPHWLRLVDNQHRWKVNAWCGIINGQIVGPNFFEGNVNGANYLNFLQNELPDLMQDVQPEIVDGMWIQQDGAPAHYARIVTNFLNEQYPERWIGRNGPIRWPARSPDLTSPDFFLWGYLKGIVYATKPTTPRDMKDRIIAACAGIPGEVLEETIHAFQRRLQLCIDADGGIFEK